MDRGLARGRRVGVRGALAEEIEGDHEVAHDLFEERELLVGQGRGRSGSPGGALDLDRVALVLEREGLLGDAQELELGFLGEHAPEVALEGDHYGVLGALAEEGQELERRDPLHEGQALDRGDSIDPDQGLLVLAAAVGRVDGVPVEEERVAAVADGEALGVLVAALEGLDQAPERVLDDLAARRVETNDLGPRG